jgi:hypothetical protein
MLRSSFPGHHMLQSGIIMPQKESLDKVRNYWPFPQLHFDYLCLGTFIPGDLAEKVGTRQDGGEKHISEDLERYKLQGKMWGIDYMPFSSKIIIVGPFLLSECQAHRRTGQLWHGCHQRDILRCLAVEAEKRTLTKRWDNTDCFVPAANHGSL